MKYSFHPQAEAEFIQAIEYYEECEAGLGCDFAVEVYSTIERIMAYPKAWPIIEEVWWTPESRQKTAEFKL